MFRRLESSLPKDFEFPPGFEGLGYQVNERDQIRMISDPRQPFNYYASKNHRFVERQREALNEAIRKNVLDRLLELPLEITRLPLGAAVSENHVPILTSKNLATADRVIVYVGQSSQDLGIIAGRIISQESIAAGSAIDFTKSALSARDEPALIITNPGQLVWLRRRQTAVSIQSFQAEVRPTAVSLPYRLDPIKNSIPKNKTIGEHIDYVLSQVINKLARPGVKIQIIAIGDGIAETKKVLDTDWTEYSKRINAFVLGEHCFWAEETKDAAFAEWFSKKARAYVVDAGHIDTPVPGRSSIHCNCYSAGEPVNIECVPIRAHASMLDFLKLINRNPDYEHEPQDLDVEDETPGSESEDPWNAVKPVPADEAGEVEGDAFIDGGREGGEPGERSAEG